MPTSVDRLNKAERKGEREVGNLVAVNFAATAGFSAIVAGLPATAITLRAEYRLDTGELGALLGLLGLGVALSQIRLGTLAGNWGLRRVLTVGLAGTAATLVAMMLFVVPTPVRIPSFGLLGFGLFVVGLLSGCVNGASGSIGMLWSVAGRHRVASMRHTAAPVGAGLGVLVLPILATQFGFAAVYGGLAVTCAGIAALVWRWLREAPQTAGRTAATMVSGMTPRLGLETWRLAVATALLCAPQVAVISFAAVFLNDVSHLDAATVGPVLAVMLCGAAVARITGGRWTERHGSRHDYLAVCALSCAGLFALLAFMVSTTTDTTVAPTITSFWVPLILLAAGSCVFAWQGVAEAELAAAAGAAGAVSAIRLANTSVFIASFIVQLGLPAMLAWTSWASVWMAASSSAVIAMLLFDRQMRSDLDICG